MRIFHIATADEWAVARSSGVLCPRSLEHEGFIHFSFADQVAASADRHFGQADELVVLEVDLPRDSGVLRVEDTYGSGARFPHVYAPIAVSEVRAVHPIVRAPDGGWAFSVNDAGAAASPDH